MINAVNISKSYDGRSLWSDLSFTVEQGTMTALTGPSGAGKSTLLNCLGLLENVDSGSISVDGQRVTGVSGGARRRFRRDRLGYLFQDYALIENATLEANLAVAVPGGLRSVRARGEDALEAVGLGGRGREPVYRLSGGEQQRLAVARLLVKQPNLVLADEPTAALDAENADRVLGLLRRMADQGCAVVIATHSKEVESHCSATLVLSEAAVVLPGSAVTKL